MTEWSQALDTLERQLSRQERVLSGSGRLPEILLLDAPAVAMTMTEQIRAIALMQRHDQLIAETLEMMKRRRARPATPYGS